MVARDAIALCEELISSLALPRSFDLDVLLTAVAARRRKPLRALATRFGPGEPNGLLISTPAGDHIFYPDNTPPLQQQHIVLHELGHLLMDHGVLGPDGHDVADAIGRMMPSTPSDPGRNAHGRSSYGDTDEVQAELFATLLAVRATAPPPSRRADLAIQAAYRGLEPLWRVLVEARPEVRFGVTAPVADDELARYQLYRRVMEIRDAQLALRAYVPFGTHECASAMARDQKLSDSAADVLLEAVELAAGLAAHRRGASAVDPGDRTAPQPASTRLLDDAVWLLRVAAIMRRLGPPADAANEFGRALALPSVPGRPLSSS